MTVIKIISKFYSHHLCLIKNYSFNFPKLTENENILIKILRVFM